MTKNRIEVSKGGKGKTVYIPLSVYRAGKYSLTISCSDPDHAFKFGTSPEQLEKFRDKLHDIFSDLVGPKQTNLT